jgi:tetratricopeptide (TPR) repeat protein
VFVALVIGRYQGWHERWLIEDGGAEPAELSADELLYAGRAAAAQQRWQDARSAFLLASARLSATTDPSVELRAAQRRAQFLTGYADAQLGRHAEAAVAYEHALRMTPEPAAELHWNLALSLKELARLEEAVDHFSLAAAHASPPGNPTALFQQGRALESLGRVAEAVDGPLHAATVVAVQKGGKDASDTDYPVALGLALASIGRNAEAAVAYATAVEMMRTSSQATGSMELGAVLVNLGNALHAMDRLSEAAFTYKQAVDTAKTVMLEATEALAATLTALEQQAAADSEQVGNGQVQQADETAALWRERAASVGRSQERYYARMIAMLPPVADHSSSVGFTSGLPDAPSARPALTMRVVRSSDLSSNQNHRGDFHRFGAGPVGGVGIIRGLASHADCDALIAFAKSTGMAAATIDSGNVDTTMRHSSSVSLPHWRSDSVATQVVARLAALLRVPLDAVAAGVEFHVVHYAVGETYPAHHDASATTRRWITMLLYLSDHDSHDTVGGHTVFGTQVGNSDGDLRAVCGRALQQTRSGIAASSPSGPLWPVEDGQSIVGVAYKGERGGGLLWSNYVQGVQSGVDPRQGELDNRARHSGCEVVEGEKWVLNIWVRLGPSFVRLAGLEG